MTIHNKMEGKYMINDIELKYEKLINKAKEYLKS